jgi:hypothetical protein
MISLEECKQYVGHLNLSDEEILDMREAIYELAGHVVEDGFGNLNVNDE